MTYATIESTMKTVLEGVTGLSTSVTLGDDGILDKGVTSAAIIEAGNMEASPLTGRLTSDVYQCRVGFYTRFTTRAATHAAFVTLRDAIIARLQNYYPDIANANLDNPYLFQVEGFATDGPPQDIAMANPNTGPVFRTQTLVVSVKQTIVI